VQIWQDGSPRLQFSCRQGHPTWILVFKEQKKQKLGDSGASGIHVFLYAWYDLFVTTQYPFLSWSQTYLCCKGWQTGVLFSNLVSHVFLGNQLDLQKEAVHATSLFLPYSLLSSR